MSKIEILDEIPKLTPEERDEIRQKLDELDDALTAEEWKREWKRTGAIPRPPFPSKR